MACENEAQAGQLISNVRVEGSDMGPRGTEGKIKYHTLNCNCCSRKRSGEKGWKTRLLRPLPVVGMTDRCWPRQDPRRWKRKPRLVPTGCIYTLAWSHPAHRAGMGPQSPRTCLWPLFHEGFSS